MGTQKDDRYNKKFLSLVFVKKSVGFLRKANIVIKMPEIPAKSQITGTVIPIQTGIYRLGNLKVGSNAPLNSVVPLQLK